MATRAIVTHQPEVACDVCGRRLLRGERPDAFIDGGDRRVVCELCIPRAVGAGWTRESEALAAAAAASASSRGGRSLIGRFRQRRGSQREERGDGERFEDGLTALEHGEERASRSWRGRQPFELADEEEHPLTNAYGGAGARRRRQAAAFPLSDVESAGGAEEDESEAEAGGSPYGGVEGGVREAEDRAYDDSAAEDRAYDDSATEDRAYGDPTDEDRSADEHPYDDSAERCAEALSAFNSSEVAGRIAGIARSLGEPAVTVRALDGEGEHVAVVVAWELCWYRYEVDLRGDQPLVTVAAEGTELHELRDEDRARNAAVDDRGRISL